MNNLKIGNLINQCRSGDPLQQIEAIHQLLDFETNLTLPVLIEMLKSTDTAVRTTAARVLGELDITDSEKAGVALLDLLSDPEAIVRSEAVDTLGILGYAPAISAIKTLLVTDPEPLVRASAAETLGDIGDASAVAELEAALGDPDNAVRAYAANSVGLLGRPSILPNLKSYLEDEQSPIVRAEIYGARYRLGAKEDLDALLKLLETADEEMATNLLNIMNDLCSRCVPLNLAADGERIRVALVMIEQRIPFLKTDARQVLTHLTMAIGI